MYRVININSSSTEIKKAEILVDNILAGLSSILENYSFLLNQKENNDIKNLIKQIEIYDKEKNTISKDRKISILNTLLEIEIKLKDVISRCWNYEINNGTMIISWLKEDEIIKNKEIISSTINTPNNINNFCDSQIGIEYEFSLDSF